MATERFFNTAGPVRPDIHYCLNPLVRIRVEGVLRLIEQQKYFVLHAPRQTGKTTCLLALMHHLNKETRFQCLYANLESAQAWREDVAMGMTAMVQEMASRARYILDDAGAEDLAEDLLQRKGPARAVGEFLTAWCERSDRPVVLLLDEVDSLVGDTLIALLRQLRAGYDRRPALFPHREAGPQLLMQAFLQRIVNSGGRVEREYGLGRMRTDLFVIWPFSVGTQKAVIELKVLHKTLDKTIVDGLAQTLGYMDRCRASEGHLVIFDRTPDRSWEEKIFVRDEEYEGKKITVWGM